MMKKFLIALVCLFVSGLIFAEEVVEIAPFMPVSPRVMSQGGAFIAVAEGYESLFYNPAGFANTVFDLTLGSASVWMYMNPALISDFVTSLHEEGAEVTPEDEAVQTADMLNLINNQVASGGIGAGLSTGFGLVTNGLGVGAALVIDSYLEGDGGMADATGDVTATLGLVAGYAFSLELAGMVLNVGADLRPMYRVHSLVDNYSALQMVTSLVSNEPVGALEIINTTPALAGIGMGIDLGGTLKMGPLQFGVSVRDLFGTPFKYYGTTVQDYLAAVESDNIESIQTEGNLVTDTKYVIPMEVSAGAAFNIGFLKPLLDLTVHGDLKDVIGVIKYQRSPWTLLHIGAEAKLLEFIRVRAGFNQGYLTMGAGIHLLFLDLNAGFFTRENGKYIGDQPNSGATLELAVRL